MVKTNQPQRQRIIKSEDEADRPLPPKESRDRIIELASERPEGFTLRRKDRTIDCGDQMLPTFKQIKRDDWRDEEKGENRYQCPAVRPHRTKQARNPVRGQRGKLPRRLLGFEQSFPNDLAQPWALWIGRKSFQLSDILGQLVD